MANQHLDPRPDLDTDAPLWDAVLTEQFARDGSDQHGLYGTLHGFRAEGARLVLDRGRLRLDPGELAEHYPGLRNLYLVPRRDELTALLAAVAQRLTEGIAA
jgi:hypothetical protein